MTCKPDPTDGVRVDMTAEVFNCPPELLVDGKIPDGLKLDQIGVKPQIVYDTREPKPPTKEDPADE